MSSHSSIVLSRIAALRKGKKISQDQMADLLKIDLKTYSNWETGKVQMSIDKIERIAKALKIPLKEIWDESVWISRPYLNSEDKPGPTLHEPDLSYSLGSKDEHINWLKAEVTKLRDQNRVLMKALDRLMNEENKVKTKN